MTNTEIIDDSEFQPYRISALLETIQYPLTMTNYLKNYGKTWYWKHMCFEYYIFTTYFNIKICISFQYID